MTEIELIARQQIEIEELKQEIGYLKDCAKEADAEIESLNIEIDDLLKLSQHPYSGSAGWGCLECNFDQKHKIHQVN